MPVQGPIVEIINLIIIIIIKKIFGRNNTKRLRFDPQEFRRLSSLEFQ